MTLIFLEFEQAIKTNAQNGPNALLIEFYSALADAKFYKLKQVFVSILISG